MIGIFDSGSGGLTVMRAIRDVLPSADILYFGDIRNAPYGTKSREELTTLTLRGLQLLQKKGATSIVSACNSVSASLAISLYDALSIAPQRLIEMVGPTVSHFKGSDARILLCATPATVHSGIYQNGFRMIGKDIECIMIPDLAGAIEFGASEAAVDEIVKKAFESVTPDNFDVLILACTHYPLALDTFKKVPHPSYIFDPAWAVAERVERELWPRESGDGKARFLISRESETFRSFVAEFFPQHAGDIVIVE